MVEFEKVGMEGSGNSSSSSYLELVAMASVLVDKDLAQRAAEILGTKSLSETIHVALLEVVNARKRLEGIDLLSQPERFDFDAAEAAWGGDQ